MNAQHYDHEKLKRLREKKGLTQKQVSEELNINRQTVFRAEAGVSASYELLCSFADYYEVRVVSLLKPRPARPIATKDIFSSAV